MREEYLVIEGIGRRVGETWLLRNISFSVKQGELLAIIGPSGAGKSTLLRLLNRLDEPTEGTITLAGKSLYALAPRVLRQRMGMVMQAPHLFPGTVADNVNFGPTQRGEPLSPEALAQRLKEVGLSGYETRDVAQLSGGEAARVSLARTLANQPEVLLLDEPTAALDEALRLDIEALLLGILRRRQHTALWVTHDLEQARRVADQVLRLQAGRMDALGPPQELLASEETS